VATTDLNRRSFLASSAATLAALMCAPAGQALGATRQASWLTGYGTAGGGFGLAQINADLTVKPLLEASHRLHKVFAHPLRQEICAPARRPNTSLLVWRDGKAPLDIKAPEGHHFYGHGVFANDGSALYLAENDTINERGLIGIYDPDQAYTRIGDFDSGGIGPHDMRLHPDGRHLIIANGGLLTHPDTGRAVLNLDTLAPNLTKLDRSTGNIAAQAALPAAQNGLSLRHIDMHPSGTVLVGAQDQFGSDTSLSMVGLWRPGRALETLSAPDNDWAAFRGYIGSVSFDQSGKVAAAASPRGGVVGFWDVQSGIPLDILPLPDVCGLAPTGAVGEFVVTAGTGTACIAAIREGKITTHRQITQALHFDNHLQMI